MSAWPAPARRAGAFAAAADGAASDSTTASRTRRRTGIGRESKPRRASEVPVPNPHVWAISVCRLTSKYMGMARWTLAFDRRTRGHEGIAVNPQITEDEL